MKSSRGGDDARLWAVIAATVRPLSGRTAPAPAPQPKAVPASPGKSRRALIAKPPATAPSRPAPPGPLEPIEPNRRRRLDLGREPMAASLDLHGLSREAAHQRLVEFVQSRWAGGARAILVITGKGARGDGVLRREVPDWLAQSPLREIVAGLSEAHPKRGGAGALYVVLRRQSR